MSISYPLSLPSGPIAGVTLHAHNVVGIAESGFTLQGQVQRHQGQRWAAEIELPPLMGTARAEPWIAFLMSLRGRYGTFLLGDPARSTPRGVATGAQNLLTFSQEFDNAAWTKIGCTVSANAATAPDGSLTADKLVESTVNETHRITVQLQAITSGVTYTARIVAKAGERSTIQYTANGALFPATYANFDLSTGAVSASGGSITASMEALPDGLYRCVVTVTALVTGTDAPGFWLIANNPAMARFTGYLGDGTSGLYLWGAQLNEGTAPLPYVRTTDTAIDGPVVSGATQTGETLVTTGWAANTTGILKAGDYIQLGSGGSARLHKLLTDASSDASGNATLDIWPRLRESPGDGTSIITQSPVGQFRLASNDTSWAWAAPLLAAIRFSAVEAL